MGRESWLHLTAPCLLMKQAQLARADDPSERDLDGDGSAKGPDGHGSVRKRHAKGVWVVAVVLELELPIPRQRHRAWRVKNDSLGRKVGQVRFEVPADLDGVRDRAAELLHRRMHGYAVDCLRRRTTRAGGGRRGVEGGGRRGEKRASSSVTARTREPPAGRVAQLVQPSVRSDVGDHRVRQLQQQVETGSEDAQPRRFKRTT